MNNSIKFFPCPCCGYETLENKLPGSFEICPICYWKDDNTQFDDPYYEGGANQISLDQAQRNFLKYGASNKSHLELVRKPTLKDKKIHFKRPFKAFLNL